MDLTNELFLEIWMVAKEYALTTKDKKQLIDSLLALFEDYGVDPEILMDLMGEDEILDKVLHERYSELMEEDEEAYDDN